MMVYSSKLSCKRTNCRLIWCIPWHSSNIADWRIRSLERGKKKTPEDKHMRTQRVQGSLSSRKVRHSLEIKHGGQWDKLQLPSSGRVRELGMWPGFYQPQPCLPALHWQKSHHVRLKGVWIICVYSALPWQLTSWLSSSQIMQPCKDTAGRSGEWQSALTKNTAQCLTSMSLPSRALRSLKSKINGDRQYIGYLHSHNLSQVISISKSPNLFPKIHKA